MAVSVADIQKAYLAYFGRPADPGGLAYWQTGDAASMKAGFAASAEYAQMYSGMTADQRVEQVYQNLLGRSSDAAGKAYWVAEFNAGRQTVSSLVDAVQAGALNEDAVTISNRVAYATSFTAALDTPEEVSGYAGTAATLAARSAVSAVITTASLNSASGSLTKTIASMVTTSTTNTSGNTTATTSNPGHAGDPVIDLGSYGKLIAPVHVDGKWFYYWDRSGDGTSAEVGSLNGGSDLARHQPTADTLDVIFTEDINGNRNPVTGTTDVFRYATLNGVRVALPIDGDGSTNDGYWLADNQATYTDLAAIWDAYNSGRMTPGTPPGWAEGIYWSATLGSTWSDFIGGYGHKTVFLSGINSMGGSANTGGDGANLHVALQVL